MSTDVARDTEIINQRICDRLVRREVGECVSMLVDHFLKNQEALSGSDYSQEDLYALCQSEDWKEPAEKHVREMDRDECAEFLDDNDVEHDAEASDAELHQAVLDHLESEVDGWSDFCRKHNIDPEIHEALEHWIVTDWFARKLKEQGEATGELFGLTIWGRGCSGQAISLDGVIRTIAHEMEILHGQKNSWIE